MLLVAGNAYTHEKLGTFYFVADHLPIIFIFTIIPIIAAFMIEKEKARQGNIVLQGTIGAALCYNIYDHFFSISIPVFQSIPLLWKILYEGSFGALLVIEAVVLWYGTKIFRNVDINNVAKNSNV